MKFRKKPVVIEANYVPVDNGNERDMEAWGHLVGWLGEIKFMITDDLGIDIPTLEGVIHASPGDWIIKGVSGEFYPCKSDIFLQTYEAVADYRGDGILETIHEFEAWQRLRFLADREMRHPGVSYPTMAEERAGLALKHEQQSPR